MSAYLDGVEVPDASIDPARHTFIGTFRTPHPMQANGAYAILCPCGRMLHYAEATRDHWALGHFDTPQYRTLEAK